MISLNFWFLARLVLIVSQVQNAIGAPHQAVACDSLKKYSVNYFISAELYDPAPSTCLFYTRYLSAAAVSYANNSDKQLKTIWDLFPCQLYDATTSNTLNPLRCIMADVKQKRAYFSNMSKAMALSCDVSATVMTDDVNKIPLDGIWGLAELPALTGRTRGSKRVDLIEAIDTQGNNLTTVWRRPESVVMGKSDGIRGAISRLGDHAQRVFSLPERKLRGLTRRGTHGAQCRLVRHDVHDGMFDDVEW